MSEYPELKLNLSAATMQSQNKYVNPNTGKTISMSKIIDENKMSDKRNLQNMIQELQQQKFRQQRKIIYDHAKVIKKREKEIDLKIRSCRDNQFTRHDKKFEANSTENLYFSKPVGLPPVGYEKGEIRKQPYINKRYKSQEQSSLDNIKTNPDLNNSRQTRFGKFNHFTQKTGQYFDQFSAYQRYPSEGDTSSLINYSTVQNIRSPQNTSIAKSSVNNNDTLKQIHSSSVVSLAPLTQSKLSQQALKNKLEHKKFWRQHYGVTQQAPFFTDLTVDTFNFKKKPIKQNKNISQKIFYPSNTYSQKRLFSEFPFKLQEQKPETKLEKQINQNFNIEMGF